jgi:hypothetical protein
MAVRELRDGEITLPIAALDQRDIGGRWEKEGTAAADNPAVTDAAPGLGRLSFKNDEREVGYELHFVRGGTELRLLLARDFGEGCAVGIVHPDDAVVSGKAVLRGAAYTRVFAVLLDDLFALRHWRHRVGSPYPAEGDARLRLENALHHAVRCLTERTYAERNARNLAGGGGEDAWWHVVHRHNR